jgi:hypothetical protein
MPDRLDPTFLLREIENLKLVYPDVWNNEEDRPLALGTETDLDPFLERAVKEVLRTEGEIKGTADELADLEARRERFKRRREAVRTLCMKVMEKAEVNKRQLTRATIFIRAGTPSVVITDETALPPDCLRMHPKPDATKIKERLARGDTVPGAEMSNAAPVLTIRK